jgi:hypothetical protein
MFGTILRGTSEGVEPTAGACEARVSRCHAVLSDGPLLKGTRCEISMDRTASRRRDMPRLPAASESVAEITRAQRNCFRYQGCHRHLLPLTKNTPTQSIPLGQKQYRSEVERWLFHLPSQGE